MFPEGFYCLDKFQDFELFKDLYHKGIISTEFNDDIIMDFCSVKPEYTDLNKEFYCVYSKNETIIGILHGFYRVEDNRSYIRDFCILRKYRRQGIGSLLLKQALKMLKQKNATGVLIDIGIFIDEQEANGMVKFLINHNFKEQKDGVWLYELV